jgi:hypothetical protein
LLDTGSFPTVIEALAATAAGGTTRPQRALKLKEYVENLVERPPINEVPEGRSGRRLSKINTALQITPGRSARAPTLASSRKPTNPQTGGRHERSKGMSDAALDSKSNVSTTSYAASKRGAGYEVYDPLGQKIGSAEEVFVNRNEEPEYVRVRIGFFGQKSVLIPVQFAEVDDERRILVLK